MADIPGLTSHCRFEQELPLAARDLHFVTLPTLEIITPKENTSLSTFFQRQVTNHEWGLRFPASKCGHTKRPRSQTQVPCDHRVTVAVTLLAQISSTWDVNFSAYAACFFLFSPFFRVRFPALAS